MGAGTDKKIADANTALVKVQTALDSVKSAADATTKAWSDMMTAYDAGKSTSAFVTALGVAIQSRKKADTDAGNAIDAAEKEIAAFESYVDTKDRTVKNPLAKKSVGSARKFIAGAKKTLGDLKKNASPFKEADNVLKLAQSTYNR